MVVNFLTGDLVYRQHRTGVHVFYHNLIDRLVNDSGSTADVKVSCYATERQVETKYPEYRNESYGNRSCFSFSLARLLSYFLPIELFFGKSDVYVCDGLIPHTLFRSKKIAVIHDLMALIYPENYSLLSRLYLHVWLRQCHRADCILTVSESTKKDIVRFLKYPAERIHVVYCGFEKTVTERDENCQTELNLSQNYFVYLGDMRPNKNILRMIQAFQQFHADYPDYQFYIAGKKAWDYDMLNAYVQKNSLGDCISFLGFVTDEEKEQLYSGAKALLFASLYEGFGIPILEAASLDCPVITSSTSSMGEIASRCCVIVDPQSVSSIVKGLYEIADEGVRAKVVDKQRQELSQYTWDAVYCAARPHLLSR